MGLLDLLIDSCFSEEKAGRVVIFPGGRRHWGYLLKSAAEELKIRSFLKMFYFAQFSMLLLGFFLTTCVVIRQASWSYRCRGDFSGDLFSCRISPLFEAFLDL